MIRTVSQLPAVLTLIHQVADASSPEIGGLVLALVREFQSYTAQADNVAQSLVRWSLDLLQAVGTLAEEEGGGTASKRLKRGPGGAARKEITRIVRWESSTQSGLVMARVAWPS